MSYERSFLGVGRVSLRKYGVTEAMRFIGNVSQLNLATNLDVQQQPDYTRLGGGTAKKVERLNTLGVDMTWLNWEPANFALAVAGTHTEVATSTITDEAAFSFKGSHVPLAHPPASITSVESNPSGTTYTAGTDYEKSAGGLWIPATSTIPNATGTPVASNILVTYETADYDNIEAAVSTSTECYVRFEGLNEADSGKAVIVDLWRLSIPPAAQIALIGQQFGELQVAGEALKDSTKGSGVSALYRVRYVQ